MVWGSVVWVLVWFGVVNKTRIYCSHAKGNKENALGEVVGTRAGVTHERCRVSHPVRRHNLRTVKKIAVKSKNKARKKTMATRRRTTKRKINWKNKKRERKKYIQDRKKEVKEKYTGIH